MNSMVLTLGGDLRVYVDYRLVLLLTVTHPNEDLMVDRYFRSG